MSNHNWPKVVEYLTGLYTALQLNEKDSEVATHYREDHISYIFRSETAHISAKVYTDHTQLLFVNPGLFGETYQCESLYKLYQHFWYYRNLLRRRYPLVCPYIYGTKAYFFNYDPKTNTHINSDLFTLLTNLGGGRKLYSSEDKEYWMITAEEAELELVRNYKFGKETKDVPYDQRS